MVQGTVVAAIIGFIILVKWINILKEYERAVTFWLGRLAPTPKGPGFTFIFWPFETMVRVSLQTIDQHTEPWGIKVSMVEVKQVDLPPEMQRAMAIQATAEREKRAKIIHAEGEFQASQQLADAAKVIATEPMTLQLRYLQTLTE